VEEAPVGSDAWQTLYQIPQGAFLDTATLILQGSQTIYLPIYGNLAGGEPESTLFRSLDGGQSWQQLADPCADASIPPMSGAMDFASAPGGYLAALCYSLSDPMTWAVMTSHDSGTVWAPRLPLPGSSDGGLIAVPSPGTLVVGSPPTSGGGPVTSTLSVSTDGGSDWETAVTDQVNLTATPLGTSLWLGFEDAMTGRWMGDDQTIWTTTDGGTDWTARSFAIG
jgi:photosystem II stability/assembly factor-like uncharacterized protein